MNFRELIPVLKTDLIVKITYTTDNSGYYDISEVNHYISTIESNPDAFVNWKILSIDFAIDKWGEEDAKFVEILVHKDIT